ncbi:MAG TPA: hypothetical protein VGS61_02570 [Acidimicrobiales bacterium]|nr:hypothetical protein [Acidimicrobiales bacterium]
MAKGMYRLRNQSTRVIAVVGLVGLSLFFGVTAVVGANPGSAHLEIGFAPGTPDRTIRSIEAQYSLTELPVSQAAAAREVSVSLATETLVLAELRADPVVVSASPLSHSLQ